MSALSPLALDCETKLIRAAQLAPEPVVFTWQQPGQAAGIVHAANARPRLREWLSDSSLLLVGHNIAFDLAVIGEWYPELRDLIFAAYRANRVTDTMLRQQLLDIAGGVYRGRVDKKGKRISHKYDLEAVAWRNAGVRLEKDAMRLSYGSLIDVPLERWPERMREMQAAARERLLELELRINEAKAAKQKKLATALSKEVEGLQAMAVSDPSRCTTYAIDDTKATLASFLSQEKHAKTYLADQFRQARAAWALYLNSAWGLCTDAAGVEILKARVQEEKDELEEELQMLGLVRKDGTRDTKAAKARMIRVCKEEDLELIRTEAHFKDDAECGGSDDCEEHICLDADACERTGDDILIAYAERTTLNKQLTNDIPALEQGVLYPIHTRYGLAGTGRSTSSKPNIQNQSKRAGFREAFVARPGMLFAECDYPYLELFTLAQCCISWLGKSKLAEVIKAGRDPHMAVAATILQKPYEWCEANKKSPEVKRARNLAKPANFGFPGGMGVPKFVLSTRKAIIKLKNGRALWEEMALTEERAAQLKEEWLATYPEMVEYFARVNWLCAKGGGRANVETLFTGRWRGNATYCATSNNGFQALGADCAKNAAWLIAEAQYYDRSSPLFNTRSVAFVHDEFIVEAPANDAAHDVAYALAERMVAGANEFLPDVPIPLSKMEPLLMKRWSKEAEARFGDNGRLIVWAA